MTFRIPSLPPILLLLFFCGAPGTSEPAPSRASGGVIRIGNSERGGKSAASRNFAPILKHLNSSGNHRYEIETFSNPEDLFDAFRSGKVDAAVLGPVNYVRAHHEFGAYAVVADGPKYFSVIIVKSDSPIQKVEELKGKSFAFGYKDSTSSHLYPLLLLSKARIKETDLGKHDFVGNHELVTEAVLAGSYDAGGLIAAAFESNKARGLRSIATSDPIPGVPVVVRKDADPRWVEAFRKSLLEFKAVNAASGDAFSRGATAVTDADYNQIRFLCKILLGEEYK